MPEPKTGSNASGRPVDIRGVDAVQRFLNRDELAQLMAALEPAERVFAAAGGLLGKAKGLLAATSHRIIFVAGKSVRSWGYNLVQRVHAEVDLDDAALTLHANNEVFVVKKVAREAAQAFADAVRDATPKTKFRWVRLVGAPEDASKDRGMYTMADERLRAIKRQLDKGSITEAEYRANRRRILENAGLPTDLKLGMSTKAPIREPPPPEPAPPEPWPDPSLRKKPTMPTKVDAKGEDAHPWPDPRLPKEDKPRRR